MTSIKLSKGQKIDLTKSNPGMDKLIAGLGWKERTSDGKDFDLDASVILLTQEGKARSAADFIYYHSPLSLCGSIRSTGDNRTGHGEGDDETIHVNLSTIPEEISRIQFIVSIHEADSRNQNFGMVKDAFIRIEDIGNNQQLIRFDLSEDYSLETAIIMAELYRHNGEWKFNAVGQGYKDGIIAILKEAGLA